MRRNVPSQPVSGVLSSQVTKESGTSSDTAVRLTFEYNVSPLIHMNETIQHSFVY